MLCAALLLALVPQAGESFLARLQDLHQVLFPGGCRRWVAPMELGAEIRAGVLPESQSEGTLADAVALRDESPDAVTANQFDFASAFHRHRDVDAARFLETSSTPRRRVRATSKTSR
mgnify:CR=1 FL=1